MTPKTDSVAVLRECPFCGGAAEFERIGSPRQSCIVACTECGARHESSEEYEECGTAWNRRAPGGEVTEEVVAAAHAYFTGWCQDEADDDGPHFTGCSQEQHEAAKRLKTALAALAARTGKGEADDR